MDRRDDRYHSPGHSDSQDLIRMLLMFCIIPRQKDILSKKQQAPVQCPAHMNRRQALYDSTWCAWQLPGKPGWSLRDDLENTLPISLICILKGPCPCVHVEILSGTRVEMQHKLLLLLPCSG